MGVMLLVPPLHTNSDWLRVVLSTPDQGGNHGQS
jgi:hypothetical protein